MTDLEIAKKSLAGHSICLCKDGDCLFSDLKGISPMISFIDGGVDLNGYSVADLVVGKAAALLFIKCGIKEVYAKTMSEKAKRVFDMRGIPYSFETVTERIINRAGTDSCPMEKAVENTDDAEEAFKLLKNQLKILKEQA